MVCGAKQAAFQSAELDLCPGLEHALYHHRDRWVACLEKGPQQPTDEAIDEAMMGTAGSEFRLVAHLLLRSSHRYRPRRNRAAPDHDHWFHHDILAAG